MADNNELMIAEANKPKEKVKGVRGEVGTTTPSSTLKKLWRANLVGRPSLKQFVRALKVKSDPTALEWFENKAGAKNDKRSDANKTRVVLERTATRASRRKKSEGNKSKSKAVDTMTVAK